MTVGESVPFALMVRLLPADGDADLQLLVTSGIEGQRLTAAKSQFVVRVWKENKGPGEALTIRASITNLQTGQVAMVQGNEALGRLAEEFALGFVERP